MNELRKSACILLMAGLYLSDYRGMAVGVITLAYFWDRLGSLAHDAAITWKAWGFEAHDSTRFPTTARVAHRKYVEWRGR